jgi:hypothetical protein
MGTEDDDVEVVAGTGILTGDPPALVVSRITPPDADTR